LSDKPHKGKGEAVGDHVNNYNTEKANNINISLTKTKGFSLNSSEISKNKMRKYAI